MEQEKPILMRLWTCTSYNSINLENMPLSWFKNLNPNVIYCLLVKFIFFIFS